MTNAFNLIDGVDGLAAGHHGDCRRGVRRHSDRARPCAGSDAAGRPGRRAVGFLVYNFAPASIFLGDSGSLRRGFPACARPRSPAGRRARRRSPTGVPLMIFALPIADSALALIRRGLARPVGRAIDSGDAAADRAARSRTHPPSPAGAGLVRAAHRAVLYAVTAVLSVLALATADVTTP